MAQNATFQLHGQARLWNGARLVAPASPPQEHALTTLPTRGALPQLLGALQAGSPFCVTDTAPPQMDVIRPADFVTLTGGSTGAPKFIHRTQASWIASFEVNGATFELPRLGQTAVLGGLGHSLALYGVLEGLQLGLQVHVLDGQRPAQQRHQLQAQQVPALYATPTQLRLLAQGGTAPLPDLRRIFCGGGALDQATMEAVKSLAPNATLHPFYGAAETSFVTIADEDTPPGSVGKAYPNVEINIRDQEIWVRSPYLFKGYLGGASPQTRWQDGFVSVGELGRMDAGGNLWITGRKSRQVNIADQLAAPEPIEAFVAETPQGGSNAVLPVEDPLRGQCFVLVLEGPQDDARGQAVLRACRQQFGPLVTPRRVVFVSELPRLASGKTDLAALNKWLETLL